jgi:hypothetical protein
MNAPQKLAAVGMVLAGALMVVGIWLLIRSWPTDSYRSIVIWEGPEHYHGTMQCRDWNEWPDVQEASPGDLVICRPVAMPTHTAEVKVEYK